jgi:hypothetical protein
MIGRLVVVGLVLALVVVAAGLYRRHRARAAAVIGPRTVPARLRLGSDRTWVVFTSPYCASCGPLVEFLRRSDPAAQVVTVDASVDVTMARDFGVMSAPTTVLADADGHVIDRFVGTRPVHRYLSDALGFNPAA